MIFKFIYVVLLEGERGGKGGKGGKRVGRRKGVRKDEVDKRRRGKENGKWERRKEERRKEEDIPC